MEAGDSDKVVDYDAVDEGLGGSEGGTASVVKMGIFSQGPLKKYVGRVAQRFPFRGGREGGAGSDLPFLTNLEAIDSTIVLSSASRIESHHTARRYSLCDPSENRRTAWAGDGWFCSSLSSTAPANFVYRTCQSISLSQTRECLKLAQYSPSSRTKLPYLAWDHENRRPTDMRPPQKDATEPF